MLVKAVINEKYRDTEIHVCKNQSDEALCRLLEEISGFINREFVVQLENGDRIMINQKDIVSFYSLNQRVFARSMGTAYLVPKKLYELEKELDERQFVRISKSEIINLKKIQKLDMSLTGTIRVIMKDGSETYTSRRNVAKLKKVLGI